MLIVTFEHPFVRAVSHAASCRTAVNPCEGSWWYRPVEQAAGEISGGGYERIAGCTVHCQLMLLSDAASHMLVTLDSRGRVRVALCSGRIVAAATSRIRCRAKQFLE